MVRAGKEVTADNKAGADKVVFLLEFNNHTSEIGREYSIMDRWKTICLSLLVLFMFVSSITVAATEQEIAASIEAGIAWLVAQQQPDGSWSELNPGGETGFALVKLCERAYELGYDSPFDPAYPHSQAVIDGFDYLFTLAQTIPIGIQPAGDPDTNGNGTGVYVTSDAWHRTYETGIAMMAVAASKTPARIITTGLLAGSTYQSALQEMVDYMAWGQVNAGQGQGGWGYTDEDELVQDRWADNSNSGYAVLGLAYAEAGDSGFTITIPGFVKSELNLWIDWVQNDVDGDFEDGGSGYIDPFGWVNILKTGNLIFEMTFYGDPIGTQRAQDALDYLGRTWNDPSGDPGWGNPAFGGFPHYQAMYCAMKGLEYRQIDTIDVGGSDTDWYQEFADAIVTTQNADGSWPWNYWGGQLLATEWALLTLEKSIPEPPMLGIYIDIKPGSCPNPLAARSEGLLPVAILGTDDFDVSTVDIATIKLAGVSPIRSSFEDVATPLDKQEECECHSAGPDGYMDLTLKFDSREIIATLGDLSLLPRVSEIPLTLSCMLMDEEITLEGTDCIRFLNLRQR